MDLSNELWIVLGKLQDAGTDLLDQHFNACLSYWVIIVLRGLPSAFKHAHEVLIIRDAHRKICIVIEKLLIGDCSIATALCTLKVGQEFMKDLILCLSSFNKIWVCGDIVNLNDISKVNQTRAISVKSVEDLLHHLCTTRGHFIAKTSQELFIRNLAITVNIVVLNECLQLDLLWEETRFYYFRAYSLKFK